MKIPFLSITLMVCLIWSFSAKSEEVEKCTVKRQIIEKDGQNYYVVSDRARTLYMISRDIYGSQKNWKNIADWNQLSEPYILSKDQQLLIKDPVTSDESSSNKILIKAWTNLHDDKMVQRLSVYDADMAACGTAEPAISEKAVPAAAATTATAAAIGEVVTAEAPSASPPAAPPPAPENTPAKSTVASEAEVEAKVDALTKNDPTEPAAAVEDQPAPTQDSASPLWNVSIGLTTSMITLTNTGTFSGVENKIYSKLSYGAELAGRFQVMENLNLWASAGIEQIEMAPADNAVIDKASQSYTRFMITAEYFLMTNLSTYFGYRHVQRPFARPSFNGTTIDAIYIPELVLGARFRLLDTSPFNAWLVGEGIYSFATEDTYQSVKDGYGYMAGVQIDYKWSQSMISIIPAYRFLKEDTKLYKNQQEAFIMSLAYTF